MRKTLAINLHSSNGSYAAYMTDIMSLTDCSSATVASSLPTLLWLQSSVVQRIGCSNAMVPVATLLQRVVTSA